jgi:hypothetical protein
MPVAAQAFSLSLGAGLGRSGAVLALVELGIPSVVHSAVSRSELIEPAPLRSGEAPAAKTHRGQDQFLGSQLAQAQSPVVQASEFRSAAIPASTTSSELVWLIAGFVVLGSGLLLLLSWRQGWSGIWGRRRGNSSRDRLLPRPGFGPRTSHERLHDPVYLRRLLEAELESSSPRKSKL